MVFGATQSSSDDVAGPIVAPDEQILRRTPTLRSVEIGDDGLIYDAEHERSHVLNASAMRVWNAIDGTVDVRQIVARLASDVAVEPEQLVDDVHQTIADLRAIGLLDQAALADPADAGVSDGAGPAARWVAHIRAGLRAVDWVGTTGPRRVAGASLEVRTNDTVLAELFARVCAPLPPTTSAQHTLTVLDRGPRYRDPFRILVDDRARGRAHTREAAAELALMEINQLALSRTPDRLLFHAGAVERDGAAIVIAGESGRGKSTLTAALVKRGFSYLTDEVVAVDPASRWVDPFPKALSLHESALGLLDVPTSDAVAVMTARLVVPSSLGDVSGGGRLALLVLLGAEGVGGIPEPRPVDDLIELLRNTFAPTFAVPLALESLRDLCLDTPVLHLDRTGLDRATRKVAEWFDAIDG